MAVNFVTLSLFLAILHSSKAECTNPTGIADRSSYAALPPNSNSPADSVLFQHILLARPEIAKREAPTQFHAVHHLITSVYNAMGAFEDLALDVWGNDQPVRFCKDAPDVVLYRSVALAYLCNMVFKDLFPAIRARFDDLATPWGIDPKLCFDKSNSDACADILTPWGLAFFRYKEISDWISRDGWNHDGSLSREFNRVAYQDWTKKPYIPANSPWKLSKADRWQPLLEHNGIGFLYNQEHVVAHIGQFGRSFFVSDKEFCSWRAPRPKYKYGKELDKLISRSSAMAEDDVTKTKIQIFDNKFSSLVFLQTGLLFGNGFQGDTWRFIEADLVSSTALYESTLLVWKEKVSHDAVRPPTRMRRDRSGRRITAYAGPNQGRQSLRAEDWEAYIRTMPHAEYPSGSACFCTAFADAMKLLFGGDEFRARGAAAPLTLSVGAGQSAVEPGLPLRDVTLKYDRWSEVARDCLQSRLDGGMHFTAAVPEGAALCGKIGQLAFDAVKALSAGSSPGFVQDYDTPLQRKARCKQWR